VGIKFLLAWSVLFWCGCDFFVSGIVPCSYVLQYRSERCGRVPGVFCSTVVGRAKVYLVCSAVHLLAVR
jgi:hypothetical protein